MADFACFSCLGLYKWQCFAYYAAMSIPELAPKVEARRIDVLIGRTVRDYMDDYDEEQADVARLLGVDQSGVSKKLRGAVKFSPYELWLLADHYHVTVDELYKRARDEGAMVHPLGLEPRTHCFSDDHSADVIDIWSGVSITDAGMGDAA